MCITTQFHTSGILEGLDKRVDSLNTVSADGWLLVTSTTNIAEGGFTTIIDTLTRDQA
jgi:hypothetical protein